MGVITILLRTFGSTVTGLLRAVPAWAWVVIAALAYGSWQHHRATAAGQQLLEQHQAAAQAQAQAASAALSETVRRMEAQHAIAQQARTEAASAAAAAADLRVAADRLRARLAAATASPSASGPAAAARGPPTQSAADLCQGLLGRTLDAAGQLAAHADASRAAGIACERAYETLKGNK